MNEQPVISRVWPWLPHLTTFTILILAIGAVANVHRVGNDFARMEQRIKVLEREFADLRARQQQSVLDALPDILAPVELRVPPR